MSPSDPGTPPQRTRSSSVRRYINWPPELWAEVESAVPESERAAFIRQAVRDALMRRAAERLYSYYSTDQEALEWADFVGDPPDE